MALPREIRNPELVVLLRVEKELASIDAKLDRLLALLAQVEEPQGERANKSEQVPASE